MWASVCIALLPIMFTNPVQGQMNSNLGEEIRLMVERDQAIRREVDKARVIPDEDSRKFAMQTLLGQQKDSERAHSERLTELLALVDPNSLTKSDSKWMPSALLLLLHSELDIQRRFLGLFREGAIKGAVPRAALANLEDRVLVRTGQPQRFGTQVKIVDGVVDGADLQDPEHVDQVRAEQGLEPMCKYLSRFTTPQVKAPARCSTADAQKTPQERKE